MKISIAMATYNGGKYIRHQLDSLLTQTRFPDELIVCDDCSTDATKSILRDFESQAPFAVRIYENTSTIGYVKNFEKALSLCTADIIFLCDQDDVWLPQKIETIEKIFLENKKVQVVKSNMLIVNSQLESFGSTQLKNILLAGGKEEDFNTGCGMAVRKSFIEIAMPFPNSIQRLWAHDRWLGRLADCIGVSTIIREPLMYYRRHENNASNWSTSNPKRPSMFTPIVQHGLTDASSGWKAEIKRLKSLELQVIKHQVVIQTLGAIDVSQIRETIKLKRLNLWSRLNLVSKRRIFRILPICRLLVSGGYHQFSGLKSAIKDIIRP